VSATGRVTAQAKVNLLLRILARDLSGYHQLETVFLRLDLGDVVTVRTGGRARSIDCDESALPVKGLLGPPDQNLGYRAAEAYRDVTGWPSGWAIQIEKKVPVGGGLGGGSADAGAVLRILNALNPAPLAADQLARIAFSLGSDVPFLTMTSPMAVGWGRGERLHALPGLEVRDIALAVFPFGIATGDAYAWLSASRSGDLPIESTIPGDFLTTWERVAKIATNDFEPVVMREHPIIGSVLKSLRKESSLAMLCGSGSTVFAVFDTKRPLKLESGVSVLWTRSADSVVAVERMG
jgi:4-diphosphocytidyl-2-C-methyl-D-erythritol kinase